MLISSAILFVLSLFVDTTAIVIAVQTPRSLKNIIIDSIAKNGLAVSLSVAPILLTSTASLAVGTSSTLKEKIASSAARIPGFGIPDIFYPDEWQGKWKTIHEISDIVKLTNDLPFLYATLGTKMSYEYISNFIEHNDNTVLDRASTAAAKAAKFTNTYALAFWEASNPNILKIDFDNGQSTNIQVTKRSMESIAKDYNTVGYSEFARIVDTPSAPPNIPKIYAYRSITRMKEVDPNTIIALDRTFVYPGDTLDVAIGSNDVNKPIATIKSKIKYTRIS